MVLDYFNDMFKFSVPGNVTEVLNFLDSRVLVGMRAQLDHPISEDEIKNAFFQMQLSITPGPDGMTPLFFQRFWEIVGMSKLFSPLG